MSNKLGATLGQSYRGTAAFSPPNLTDEKNIRPTVNQWANYSLGDFWLNEIVDTSTGSPVDTSELWYLASKAGNSQSRGSRGLWLMLSAGFGPILKIAGDVGTANPQLGIIELLGQPQAGGTVNFIVNPDGGNQVRLHTTDANSNTSIGLDALVSLTTGFGNTAFGSDALELLTTGSLNTVVGTSGFNITTGSRNTIIGAGSAVALTTGSDNILIGAGVLTLPGQNNVLEIGAGSGTGAGELDASYIHGIYQRDVGVTALPVWVDSAGKLGTQVSGTPFYQEGTFTPTIKFGGNSVSVIYGGQAGTYTKIGNVINFHLSVAITDKGSSTGFFTVAGLPFQTNPLISPQEGFLFTWQNGITLTAGHESIWGQSDAVTLGEINVNEGGSGVSSNILDNTYFDTSFAFSLHGFYFANV